jgi:hypothetical protein
MYFGVKPVKEDVERRRGIVLMKDSPVIKMLLA